MNEHPALWFGRCTSCNREFEISDDALLDVTGFETGELTIPCDCRAAATVSISRSTVKVVPFSSWTVLPAATGCPECGTDHPPEIPHNPQTLLYQYAFRSREARAGREERWPTWRDAMAHCTPEVQEAWTQALAQHGVILD